MQATLGLPLSPCRSLLAWRNPAQTIVVLGLCGLALAVIQFVASGGLGISLVEGVAYVLLARLAMGFVSATLGASSRDSAQVWDATIDWASSSLRSVCQGYETAIHNPNPHATLAFTLALWAVAVVGRVLRPHHVAWLVLGVAFAAAPAWARLHRVVKCGWSFAAEALDHQMEASAAPCMCLLSQSAGHSASPRHLYSFAAPTPLDFLRSH